MAPHTACSSGAVAELVAHAAEHSHAKGYGQYNTRYLLSAFVVGLMLDGTSTLPGGTLGILTFAVT